MARVVLVEPYYGGSHQAWADAWVRHSSHDIVLLTHPDEFWRWRLRGASVTLAASLQAHIEDQGRPDVVVVSSMVDVAGFIGQARRVLDATPVAVYVHESQLLYPPAPRHRSDTSAALTNWRSLVAADAIWFNSRFHQDALREALPQLLGSQPEPDHLHLLDPVFERAQVLWPGVEAARLIDSPRSERPTPRVLWNQRWDHDKNPKAVFAALVDLANDGVAFTVALAGQNQRPDNPEFAYVQEHLGDRIDHRGFLPQPEYEQLLLASDVVVSAADHEFFGIALVEAMAAGALPVLPHRLSFPELVESRWHPRALYGDGDLRARLQYTLEDLSGARVALDGLRESMRRFDAFGAAQAHDRAVLELIG